MSNSNSRRARIFVHFSAHKQTYAHTVLTHWLTFLHRHKNKISLLFVQSCTISCRVEKLFNRKTFGLFLVFRKMAFVYRSVHRGGTVLHQYQEEPIVGSSVSFSFGNLFTEALAKLTKVWYGTNLVSKEVEHATSGTVFISSDKVFLIHAYN